MKKLLGICVCYFWGFIYGLIHKCFFLFFLVFGGATAQNGTTIKFNPPQGQDTMMKNGTSASIQTRHQCITAMKEYENKSLEVNCFWSFPLYVVNDIFQQIGNKPSVINRWQISDLSKVTDPYFCDIHIHDWLRLNKFIRYSCCS